MKHGMQPGQRIRVSAALVVIFIILAVSTGCFNRQRFNNFNWQLDSLKIYTVRSDSMIRMQSKEIAQLRTDYYTKSDELGEKLEMLNTRLNETEMQLTQLNEKLGKGRKPAADSEDVSQLSPEARMVYESAYLNYVKGNYQDAISGFESYLKIAAESPLSDNALYWIGESYAALGKLQDAVNKFNELCTRYPDSNRKPTALYQMGIIYEEARDTKTARSYFEKLVTEFPNSPEAALAKDKLK